MRRESLEERRARARRIASRLRRAYPDARPALQFSSPFQLLVATILSAQCTDARVNQVTARLFARFGSPEKLAAADPAEIEALVRPTGFYRRKARAIQEAARQIVERFSGEVPQTLEELTSLPGVARKTANVVLGSCFGVPGIVVDTHVKRVSQRLGLTRQQDPEKIERELMQLLPRRQWTAVSHRCIQHGRACCHARRPLCDRCPLRRECSWPEAGAGGGSPAPRRQASR